MGLSTNTTVYSGGAQIFGVNFSLGFLSRADVFVRVNSAVDGSGDPLYSDFTWIDDSNILVTPTLTIGDTVEVLRTVSKTELAANFAISTDVTPANLDVSAKQGLMVYQELIDGRVEGTESPIIAGDRAEAAALQAEASAALAAADAVLTAADVVSTGADVVSTNADAAATAADLVQTNIDQLAVAADKALVAADVVVSSQNAIDTAADLVNTTADVLAAAASAAAALVSEGAAATSEFNSDASATAAAGSAVDAANAVANVYTKTEADNGFVTVTGSVSTSAAELPVGTDAERPAPVTGHIRFSTTGNSFEGYNGSAWGAIGGGGYFKGDNGTVGSATGSADIFRVNEQTLNTSTTIDADENASATGPLAVATGVTLTVTTGGNLSIV